MDKVKVSKDVFKELQEWEKTIYKPLESALIIRSLNDGFVNNKFEALNQLGLEELAKCLILGYELEETVEDKLIRYYEERCEGSDSGECVKDVLDILSIKIKGINE